MADLVLPKWGLSMREATVVKWHKLPGDKVAVGEPVVDVETDKVEASVESPFAGTLRKILVQTEETVPVGSRLAVID